MSKISDALDKIYTDDKNKKETSTVLLEQVNKLAPTIDSITSQMNVLRKSKFTMSPVERARQMAELKQKRMNMLKSQIRAKRASKEKIRQGLV
jgi:hypothetical protein